jgi:hypothetical protein
MLLTASLPHCTKSAEHISFPVYTVVLLFPICLDSSILTCLDSNNILLNFLCLF